MLYVKYLSGHESIFLYCSGNKEFQQTINCECTFLFEIHLCTLYISQKFGNIAIFVFERVLCCIYLIKNTEKKQ